MNVVLAKRFSAKSLDIAFINVILYGTFALIPKYELKFYASAFCFIIYEFICIGFLQTTLGKHLFKVKLVDNTNNSISPFKALFRSPLSLFSMYFIMLGILYAFTNKDRLTLHDKILGTKVVDLDP